MRKMAEFNGDRLKIARMYRGLTVAELAEKLELQRQTVSAYENKRHLNPEINTIIKMSNVLGFPKRFFMQNGSLDVKEGTTYFRSLLTTSKKYRNQQILKVDFLIKIFNYLSEYIEFPTLNLPEKLFDDPIEAAAELRDLWGLSNKPIDNIVYLVEKNGLLVTEFESDTNDIDAFSRYIEANGYEKYLIGYSKNKNTAPRIHFDIAHELGHILLHEWSEDIESLDKEEFKNKENQANLFAANFLLPEDAFVRDIGKYADNLQYYVELKKKWKVSISAMIRRSYSLGLISNVTYQNLMRNMQKKGIKKFEPLDDILITSKPSLLKMSIQMLLSEGVLTPSEILDELSINHNFSIESVEIEKLLDLPKDTLKIEISKPVHLLTLRNNDDLLKE